MGFIRGAGVAIISVILFLLLLSGGTFLVLNNSLKYENVKGEITNISYDLMETQEIKPLLEETAPIIKIYCKNQTEDYVLNAEGQTIVIPCENITTESTNQEVINYVVNKTVSNIVEDSYYKEYNCEFTECFSKEKVPLFLVSEKAKNFWLSLFYKVLIAAIILIALLFLLVHKKTNGFIIAGALFIISSVIIGKLKTVGSWIAKAILSPVSTVFSNTDSTNIISKIVNLFFSESPQIFWKMFIFGIILLVIGIVLKLTKFGIKISGIFNKKEEVSKEEIKEIVRKEISKDKAKIKTKTTPKTITNIKKENPDKTEIKNETPSKITKPNIKEKQKTNKNK